MPSFSGVQLSQEQVQLLKKRIVEEETALLTFEAARSLYSSKTAARNALQSLQEKGVIDRVGPGKYKISSLPEELHEKWIS